MSESCDHNCSGCSSDCEERTSPKSFQVEINPLSSVKKVIGIVSGKGGVGKSLVTSLLAVSMQRKGYHVGILDADITGPSIPKAFGMTGKAISDETYIYPAESQSGIHVMSTNLLLEEDTQPVIWRGPIIAGAVKQFWTDVVWGDLDYMFVDMPPGTGDVALTVFQSLPIDGIVVVTSPQELVEMIVGKAINMAAQMNVPVLGLVENMSYFECPNCHARHEIFGKSNIEEFAKKHGIDTVIKIPIQSNLADLCDTGHIEKFSGDWLDKMAETIVQLPIK
ncbi:MAG: Mrp/NBP35 family ATP-binding protein [bacterium]|nr:Mrp/NBP35 family ATP-binding protein [bacterium]